jgi:hypothetical protein
LISVKVNGVPLPDARLNLYARRRRTELTAGSQRFEQVYCVNCGTAGGLVYLGCPVFYLCDGCVERHGPPPGAVELT